MAFERAIDCYERWAASAARKWLWEKKGGWAADCSIFFCVCVGFFPPFFFSAFSFSFLPIIIRLDWHSRCLTLRPMILQRPVFCCVLVNMAVAIWIIAGHGCCSVFLSLKNDSFEKKIFDSPKVMDSGILFILFDSYIQPCNLVSLGKLVHVQNQKTGINSEWAGFCVFLHYYFWLYTDLYTVMSLLILLLLLLDTLSGIYYYGLCIDIYGLAHGFTLLVHKNSCIWFSLLLLYH